MTIDRQQFLDELKLREQIRRAISIIGERKQAQQMQMLSEEKRLRKVIRSFLKKKRGKAMSQQASLIFVEISRKQFQS